MRDQAELDAYKMVPVKMDEKGMAYFNGVGTENSGKDALYSISGEEVADIITYDDKKKEMHWLNEGSDYTGNLARANNEEVEKLIPVLQQVAGSDIKSILAKIKTAIEQGKMSDTNTRNIATAIGSIAYTSMGE